MHAVNTGNDAEQQHPAAPSHADPSAARAPSAVQTAAASGGHFIAAPFAAASLPVPAIAGDAQSTIVPAVGASAAGASPAVVENERRQVGDFSSAAAAAADSPKSFPRSPIGAPQPQRQAAGARNGGDRGEKHGSTPSSDPPASAQRANLLAPHGPDDCNRQSEPPGSPSSTISMQDVEQQEQEQSARRASDGVTAAAPRSPSHGLQAAAPSSGSLPSASPVPAGRPYADASSFACADASAARPAAHGGTAPSSSAGRIGASDTSFVAVFEQSLRQHAQRKQSQQRGREASADGSSMSSGAAAQSGLQRPAVDLGLGDETCHCLVVHPALLDPEGEAKHKSIVAAEQDSMKELAVHWLPALDPASIAVVFAAGRDAASRRLHIQFHTRAGLAAALKACPVLIQCSALHPGPKSSWDQRATYCGPARHELPEKLDLVCQPAGRAAAVDGGS